MINYGREGQNNIISNSKNNININMNKLSNNNNNNVYNGQRNYIDSINIAGLNVQNNSSLLYEGSGSPVRTSVKVHGPPGGYSSIKFG